MEALVDPFTQNPFMLRALLAACATVVATSLVGTWVVLRGMTFLGDAMAHGVLPGIAVAFVLGLNLTLGAAVSAAVMVAGINLVRRRSRLPDDVGIGLLFVGMLALGVTIMSLEGPYAGDLTAILFGDAIGVGWGDVILASAVAVLTGMVAFVGHRAFVALTFSPAKAAALGFRPGLTHAVLLTLVAATVVAAFRTVGTLLVFALLVAPPAAATLVASRVPHAMAVSVGLGWIAVYLGLLASWHLGTPASPSIALVAVVVFFVVAMVPGRRQLQV